MDLNIIFGLWFTGTITFMVICAYKYRNLDVGKSIKKIPKPTWPRTKLEEIFGV